MRLLVAADLPIDLSCGPKRADRQVRRSFLAVLADERGMTLVMALLMMVVLTSVSTTAILYTTSNMHATGLSRASTSAFDVAEAGMNDSVAKMYGQLNSDGSVMVGGTSPLTSTLFPTCVGSPAPTPTKIVYANVGGEAWICGDYNAAATSSTITVAGVLTTIAGYTWRLQSVGRVSSAGVLQTRTLSKAVKVVGLNDGANGSSWSRFYQDSTSSCLTIDTDVFVTNVATRGNLCILNTGAITGAGTTIDVGGNVTITGPVATAGPPTRVATAGTGWTNPANVYTDNSVYATNIIPANTTGANQDTTGFGFVIPATAKILGITASVDRFASACCNAVQTISETGSPTGGSFKLSGTPPGGSPTISVAIAYNASAATVQAALVTIYGTGNVVCTGGALPANVVCTFQGTHASKAVTLMSLSSKALTGGTSPAPAFANTTVGSTGALQDITVQLLKAAAPVGSNYASASTWGTSSSFAPYGGPADLWGTTWTPAQVNATNFGLRFAAKNVAAASSTASVDYVSITVTYNDDTNGIGTASIPISKANIGGTCTYNGYGPACNAIEHVNATTITSVAAASNPALSMPAVDFNNWWANAMPGPKHFCTNLSPGLSTSFFDNNAGSTSAPDRSLNVNGEMAPATTDYTCQVWSTPPTSGTLLGELSWNHTTHILTIFGTIFVDGNFRFDEDGEVIHYHGRATIMSSRDDEIDALVCAGGTGTTYAGTGSPVTGASCLTDMTNWDTSQNMMVLMSQENNEYDQGGTNCTGNTHPGCYNGHLPAGFQGIMYSTADCLIHQNFQDSGPVICNTISLPNESGVDPSFYSFPSIGNLTDGQKYSYTPLASNFELDPGDQTGG
jgi:Tfp pilus assembly protein PilX